MGRGGQSPWPYALAFLLIEAAGVAHAQGDAAVGQHLFGQCKGCHAHTQTAPARIGPTLAGVVDRRAASRSDYMYSPALAGSGLVWNAATLDAYLTRPAAVVPGTRMVFGGIADPTQRSDLIAYLATLH